MNWTDTLTTIDVETLAAPLPSMAVADADKATQIGSDRRHVGRTERAVMLDARRLQNAIKHIGRLPDPGEAFHLITEKAYSMMHVIPAVLHYAAPVRIRYLAIVTLSFSRVNMVDLLAMIDSGEIERVDFAYSVYFKSNNKDQCTQLAEGLTARGQRVYSGLIHAKILLIELDDGRAFTVESSANLRSCASVEQITIFHDRPLLEFHRTWISGLMENQTK
jgi:hypothetical protein